MAHRPDFPFEAADQCVKCGLCLPHCPSYGQTGHEGDSPRGRITLMQALASGALAATDGLQAHLDGCLGCRACEPVCPARVPYHQILDAGRARLLAERPQPGLRHWITALTHPLGQRLLRWSARLWQVSTLGRLAARHAHRHPLIRLLSLLPPKVGRPAQTITRPTSVTKQPEFWRFGSCVGAALDPATDEAAQAVLGALGIASRSLTGVCCGAMARHAGLADLAAQQESALARAAGTRPIVSLASGCAAQLRTHPDAALRAGHHEVLSLIRQRWPADLTPRSLPLRVAVQRPCTHRNALGSDADIDGLLARIPGLTVVELDAVPSCCGAAGHHLLAHPRIADAHLAPKLAAASALSPQIIVSSNIGCATHIAAGLRRQGLHDIEVMHPVRLLALALRAPRPGLARADHPIALRDESGSARPARSAGRHADVLPRRLWPAPDPR